MKKLILAIITVLSFMSFNAYAVDVGLYPTTNYNCKVPTQREDDTAFDWATEGSVIRFYSGTSSGNYTNIVERPVCQWVIDNTAYPPGTKLYIVSTAVDKDMRESRYNAEIVHTIDAAVLPPKSPTGAVLEHIPAR